MLLLFLPLLAGGLRFGWLQYARVRCGLEAFQQARAELIRTGEAVDHRHRCEGGLVERIRLVPLERLDQTGRASHSWGDVSSFWP